MLTIERKIENELADFFTREGWRVVTGARRYAVWGSECECGEEATTEINLTALAAQIKDKINA